MSSAFSKEERVSLEDIFMEVEAKTINRKAGHPDKPAPRTKRMSGSALDSMFEQFRLEQRAAAEKASDVRLQKEKNA